MNKVTKARLIDELAVIKARQATLITDAEMLADRIKKAGGGESTHWRALLVKIPKHTVTIKTHKQLRLYSKEAA